MKNVFNQATVLWHALQTNELLSNLESSPFGLTSIEAARRLKEIGPNELQAVQRVSVFTLFLEQFKNVMIIILLIATLLSASLGHTTEAIAIGIIVLFAVLLGFAQEFRAERAIDALRKMAAPMATVLRDNEEIELPASLLVPGDVILLTAGDKIPADARLVECFNLLIEEAALTGESVPVEKHAHPILSEDMQIGDRKNMIYAGTAATYGRGRAVVVATGMNTEFGKIAKMLQTVETGRTPLQENLDKAGHMLGRAAIVIVAIIVALGLFRGQPFIEMLIFGIALAVAVVPEALPAVVTISLALGVQRMVKRNALMRRLPAVETLGSTSIICSDKTGTLTKDEMTVRAFAMAGKIFDVTGTGYEPVGRFVDNDAEVSVTENMKAFLHAAVLASDAHIAYNESESRWHVKGDPTEGALVVLAAKAGMLKAELDSQYPRVNEIPFSSETKRMTTLHSMPEGITAYSKGAPEIILASCTKCLNDSGEQLFGQDEREKILESARLMAARAMRVLAVASKNQATFESAENDMTFLGLVGMIDPPRPEAKVAIQKCKEAGIKVVMITGDHPLTAQAVARELGLLGQGRAITGSELDEIGETEFEQQVHDIEVYARVSPAHKLRVVTALQKNGHIVAMTGDGVNDAPALKKADIGIAMGITGTDVTKEASAMTLTDDNFASIVAAVEEGRGIFGNIKKYLMYLLSANIGEIGLMVGATLLGMPMPLTAVQILYVNLATDGLPALALAIDPPEHDLMKNKPRDPRTGIFTRPVVALMVLGGAWSCIVNLALFVWAFNSGRCLQEAMTMTFVSLVLIQFFTAYNYRSDHISVFVKPFANKWLNLAVAWEFVLLIMVIYLPMMHEPFGTFSLTAVDWAIVVTVAFTITPVLELGKMLENRGLFKSTV